MPGQLKQHVDCPRDVDMKELMKTKEAINDPSKSNSKSSKSQNATQIAFSSNPETYIFCPIFLEQSKYFVLMTALLYAHWTELMC